MTAVITPELIAQHQLTPEEYQKIVRILDREPITQNSASSA